MQRATGRIGGVLTAVLLSGCVGTIDSLHYVVGEAPANAECEVQVAEAGTADVISQDPVQGRFKVGFVASGPFPSKVDIAAYCNGTKVKELKAVAPRRVNTIDLGKLGS